MCRGKNDGGSRRCPCDTSEKRRLRRVNRGSLNKVSSVKLAETDTPPVLESHIKGYSPSSDHGENVQSLMSLYNQDGLSNKDKMEISVETGRELSRAAEQKAGVSEEEYAQIIKDRDAADKEVSVVVDDLVEKRGHLKNLEGEERDKAEDEWDRLNEKKKELQAKRNEMFTKANEAHVALGEAYTQAIGEARDEEMGVGKDGLTLSKTAKSNNKKAAKTLASSLTCYPRSWVERSNKYGLDLVPAFTRTRAHYQGMKLVASGNTRIVPTSFTDGEVPLELAHKYRELTHNETQEHLTGTGIAYPTEKYYEELNVTYHNGFYHGEDENGDPITKGWKKTTIYRNDGFGGHTSQEQWIKTRRVQRQKTNDKVAVSYISMPEYAGENVARHEFAHRMEHVSPEISHLEKEYLYSRVSEGEKIVEIYDDDKEEVAYADKFNNAYTGKVYRDSTGEDSKQHYEIMSTGVEDIFAGTANQSIIAKGGRVDSDLKHFVLGTLTTVGNKKR